MKSKYYFYVFIVLIVFSLFVSCKPETEVPSEISYSTPTIKGTISLPSGSNVNPSEIYLKVVDESGNTAKVDKVNSDKTFVIQGLKEGTKYSILFTSEEPDHSNMRGLTRDPDKSNGVGGWLHDVVPAIQEGNNVGNVKLKPLGTIKGKAFIEGESEHYDITVYIPGTSCIAKTDKDGSFSIYNVPEGNYTLRYTLDDHLPIMLSDVMLVCPEDVEKPEVTVKNVTLKSSLGTVEGVASFDGLSEHSGISVKLESEDKTKSAQASTSEDGGYILNNIDPGVYRVIVSAPGYVTMTSGYFSVESATITTVPEQVVLFRNIGSANGNVKLSDGRADNTGIVISFISSETCFTAVTDKDGNFSRSLKPGNYTVTASYPGFTSQSLNIAVVENSVTEVNIPSLPLASGAVAGFVLLSGSEDYSGVVVTLTNSAALTESYTAVSAADGSFRITGLNKGGTYLLSYSKDGYVSENTKSIDVTVGSIANAGTVTLRSTFATVKGTIQLEGASSYENVTVLLRNDANQYTTTTDQKGGYILNRVLPGTYTLLASKDGYVTSTPFEIVVEPSSEKTIEDRILSVAIRSVTGKVTLELLSDYSGVLVTATNISDNTLIYSAITNTQGDFSLSGLPEGEYKVEYSKTSFITKTIESVVVKYDEDYRFNIAEVSLQIAKGKIEGKVTDEEKKGLKGITVTVVEQNSDSVFSVITDEYGSYSFDLCQGNYRISFTGLCRKNNTLETTIVLLSGKTFVVNDIELESDHIWDKGIITKNSTCTEEGDKLFTCTRCGSERHSTIIKLGHDTVYHPAVEATCIKPGNTVYWECRNCKKHLSSKYGDTEINEVIPAKGHSLSYVEYLAPTCEEYGHDAHYKCSECSLCFVDDKMVDYETLQISPIGHKKKEIRIRENTKTHDIEFIFYCTNCESEVSEVFIPSKDQEYMTELIIPEGVVEIEDNTFNGFSRIEKIVFPSTLKIIGSRCFDTVPGPLKVVLDDALIRIGEYSFVGTYFLELVLPSSNLCFDTNALMDAGICKLVIPANYSGSIPTECWWISEVEVDPECAKYHVQDCLLMAGNSLIMILSNSGDEIVITDTMNVGGDVFVHKGAGKLVLPDGLKLWEGMFFQSSFGEIVFPSDIKSIPKHAFEMASGPVILEIPEGVEKIEECAFFYGMMEEITLPTTIKEIENCALSDMSYLRKLTILAKTPPKISYNYFCLPDFQIFVPKESLDLYLNDSNWSEYTKYLYPIEDE